VAANGYVSPEWASNPSNLSPTIVGYNYAQAAAWRSGDFLQIINTGTITAPNPNGSISTSVGPTVPSVQLVSSSTSVVTGPVTIAASTSAGTAAQTYYVYLTYQGAANIEGVPGAEFIINAASGIVPTITVTNVGSPTNSTGTGVYVGTYPGGEVQQAVTTFASTTTLASPLTNNTGINRSVTNPSTLIVGLAINNSTQQFFSGTGGAFTVGDQSLFGATNSLSPLNPTESLLGYVISAASGTLFEISLKQAWYPSLVGSAKAGLTLDTTSGFFIADTSASNKVLNILRLATSVPVATPGIPVTGQVGDTGARVIVSFASGTF
jgi:hypothetical protein